MSSGPAHIGEIREKFSGIRVRWDAYQAIHVNSIRWAHSGGLEVTILCICKHVLRRNSLCRHAGEGGQEGAGAPPAFQLGEQGEQKRPFKCNDLLSNC